MTIKKPLAIKQPEVGQIIRDLRLLYVAMTRAIEQLIMSCDRSSQFTSRLETALGKVVVIWLYLSFIQASIAITLSIKRGKVKDA
jgi:ATP-dependent exoDNAse (exonuclease V) beta subunit